MAITKSAAEAASSGLDRAQRRDRGRDARQWPEPDAGRALVRRRAALVELARVLAEQA
ncbi:hypothetical protein [Nonomuraea africana]|uniref:hypothetical protein n=1 Tax=Nonomuraea africana TaxID=46171 RepID=UPI0033F835BE